MSDDLASVRLRVKLHQQLRLLAADLAQKQRRKITIRSLLEEGIRGLFTWSLETWIRWANEGMAPVSVGEPSISFRINADLVRDVGLLAARIEAQSGVPITKIHLMEEAGRRILAHVQEDQAEMQNLLREIEEEATSA